MLKTLNTQPNEVLYVGDDLHMDYEVPKSMRMQALFLDRTREVQDSHVIHTLEALKAIL